MVNIYAIDYSQDILIAVPHVTCLIIYIYICLIVCIYISYNIYITFRHEQYPATLLLTIIKHRVHILQNHPMIQEHVPDLLISNLNLSTKKKFGAERPRLLCEGRTYSWSRYEARPKWMTSGTHGGKPQCMAQIAT